MESENEADVADEVSNLAVNDDGDASENPSTPWVRKVEENHIQWRMNGHNTILFIELKEVANLSVPCSKESLLFIMKNLR